MNVDFDIKENKLHKNVDEHKCINYFCDMKLISNFEI